MMKRVEWTIVSLACFTSTMCSAEIETTFLQQPWPGQVVQQLEVGRYDVRWRQRISRTQGLLAGAAFTVPVDRGRVWQRATAYTDLARLIPGVLAVRVLEQQPQRHVVQVDLNVLWRTLHLTFEIEPEPPEAIRFQLINQFIGEYRGVCLFQELPRISANGTSSTVTRVDLATWYQPSRPVPMRLLLLVERIALLQGIKGFLASCEPPVHAPHDAPSH